eukprot:UN02138
MFGSCMSAFAKKNENLFMINIQKCRLNVMKSLTISCRESYERIYTYLIDLQILQELESAGVCILKDDNLGDIQFDCNNNNRLFWKERLGRTQDNFTVKEKILAARRCILKVAELSENEGDCWLKLMSESLKIGDSYR